MSWISNLVETYDRIADSVGIADAKGLMLMPLYHMWALSSICITIDGEGRFQRAVKDKNAIEIPIPCTEKSQSSRTSLALCPHPLQENLGYLTLDANKREVYLQQLAKWCGSHPKVAAVYKYICADSIRSDLEQFGIKIDKISNNEKSKVVRFCVEIGTDNPELWSDKSVWNAWIDYVKAHVSDDVSLCYVTGKKLPAAKQHPKGINKSANGAKLISINDETNFTYRGRFTNKDQANSISLEASQKAHAMLTYLIRKQGYKCGTQAIVTWAIDDDTALPDPLQEWLPISDEETKTGNDILIKAEGSIDTRYALAQRSALSGYGDERRLHEHSKKVAIIAMDAATTGRMSITYYQELTANEYHKRIDAWHESCRWWFKHDGKMYFSAPGFDAIFAAVYGSSHGQRGKEDSSYEKIKKQAKERMLHCIFNGERVSRDWVNSALCRASSPLSYTNNKGWDSNAWERSAAVACALTRIYLKEKNSDMELERQRTDRSYLYGRLLAIANRIESYAMWKQSKGKEGIEKRPTNAIRYMQRFSNRPFTTWNQLFSQQLNPYIQYLDGAGNFMAEINEIFTLFEPGDYESDSPLDGKYLMGYSLQSCEYSHKNDKTTTNNTDNTEESDNVE